MAIDDAWRTRIPQGWIQFPDGSVGPPNQIGSDWNAPYRQPPTGGMGYPSQGVLPVNQPGTPSGVGGTTGYKGPPLSGSPSSASMGFPAQEQGTTLNSTPEPPPPEILEPGGGGSGVLDWLRRLRGWGTPAGLAAGAGTLAYEGIKNENQAGNVPVHGTGPDDSGGVVPLSQEEIYNRQRSGSGYGVNAPGGPTTPSSGSGYGGMPPSAWGGPVPTPPVRPTGTGGGSRGGGGGKAGGRSPATRPAPPMMNLQPQPGWGVIDRPNADVVGGARGSGGPPQMGAFDLSSLWSHPAVQQAAAAPRAPVRGPLARGALTRRPTQNQSQQQGDGMSNAPGSMGPLQKGTVWPNQMGPWQHIWNVPYQGEMDPGTAASVYGGGS